MSQAGGTITTEPMEDPKKTGFRPDWFLFVETIETPKDIKSLIDIWDVLSKKQIAKWTKHDEDGPEVAQCALTLLDLIGKCDEFSDQDSAVMRDRDEEYEKGQMYRVPEVERYLNSILSMQDKDKSYRILHCVVRAIHIKIHLRDLDEESRGFLKPRRQIYHQTDDHVLHSKLILQSYLSFLNHEYNGNGHDLELTFKRFDQLVNKCMLRLVSTVHPNETERAINLLHYTRILDQYIRWKRDWMSLQGLALNAPEYRIRREQLNHLRRQMKGEIEAIWQSDQLRTRPITVTAEGRRLMDRYRIIFESFPFHQKFCKQLVAEAYWLFNASIQAQKGNSEWLDKFSQIWGTISEDTRLDRVASIKKTFKDLDMTRSLPPKPSLQNPVMSFATWKGGDRDGNPYVVAAFTNQTFVEQKLFVLRYYVDFVKSLVDKITPSTHNVQLSEELHESVRADAKKFPFIDTIKFNEPYRAKLRYILEKLTNSLHRTTEVWEKAGENTKPLLSLTLPGPSGYTTAQELQEDVQVVYSSLILNDGKSQARSQIQDLSILVQTFGLHMCSVDFRQVSTQNATSVNEFLIAMDHPYGNELQNTKDEQAKRRMLLDLIVSPDLEFDSSYLSQLSRLSRDTFQTLLIYADAARTDPNIVGKFIISMCRNVSDILNVMLLLKLSGMLTLDYSGPEVDIVCNQDVTGLYETIEDLKNAPKIIEELLAIPIVNRYIVNCRKRKVTVMLGYSDSVRDGSSLCSDAQVARACLKFHELEMQLQQSGSPLEFVFYRGRGDTLPRGYGGNIKRSITAQGYTTQQEDHTEQNRYLRKYATVSSALDHFHSIYAAHVSAVVDQIMKKGPVHANNIYQKVFELCGHLSNSKWLHLVSDKGLGKLYFSILANYSILPILPGCQFASRPVCRSGVNYNIDNIRAIPFTMDLAQMREFTVAFYGCGTGFEQASKLFDLKNRHAVVNSLSKLLTDDKNQLPDTFQRLITSTKTSSSVSANEKDTSSELEQLLSNLVRFYPNNRVCVEEVSSILLFLDDKNQDFMSLLLEMYKAYAPFRYSIDNKIQALLIRNKRIVDEYTRNASEEEKQVLQNTENEAQLSLQWVLKINPSVYSNNKLSHRFAQRNYRSVELLVLHKIQSKMLEGYHELLQKENRGSRKEQQILSIYLQMTILAISEALGFGG